jgi:hypothetical protein
LFFLISSFVVLLFHILLSFFFHSSFVFLFICVLHSLLLSDAQYKIAVPHWTVVNERHECIITTRLLAYVWCRSGSTSSKAGSILTSLHPNIGQRVEIAVSASPFSSLSTPKYVYHTSVIILNNIHNGKWTPDTGHWTVVTEYSLCLCNEVVKVI